MMHTIPWHHRVRDKLLVYHLNILVEHIRDSHKFWRTEGITRVIHSHIGVESSAATTLKISKAFHTASNWKRHYISCYCHLTTNLAWLAQWKYTGIFKFFHCWFKQFLKPKKASQDIVLLHWLKCQDKYLSTILGNVSFPVTGEFTHQSAVHYYVYPTQQIMNY